MGGASGEAAARHKLNAHDLVKQSAVDAFRIHPKIESMTWLEAISLTASAAADLAAFLGAATGAVLAAQAFLKNHERHRHVRRSAPG